MKREFYAIKNYQSRQWWLGYLMLINKTHQWNSDELPFRWVKQNSKIPFTCEERKKVVNASVPNHKTFRRAGVGMGTSTTPALPWRCRSRIQKCVGVCACVVCTRHDLLRPTTIYAEASPPLKEGRDLQHQCSTRAASRANRMSWCCARDATCGESNDWVLLFPHSLLHRCNWCRQVE